MQVQSPVKGRLPVPDSTKFTVGNEEIITRRQTRAQNDSDGAHVLDVHVSSSGVTYESDEVPFVRPEFAGRAQPSGVSVSEDIVSPTGPFRDYQNSTENVSYL